MIWDHISYGGFATDASVDISADTSVDTQSIEYRSIHRSSIDQYIDWYSNWSIYLVVHWDLTDNAPMLQWYFTFTKCLGWYRSIFGWYIGRHSSVDKYSSNASSICWYIGRYIGRYYLVSVNIWVNSIWYRSIHRWIVSSINQYISRYISR